MVCGCDGVHASKYSLTPVTSDRDEREMEVSAKYVETDQAR
jgi:hypothetical protein